MGMCGPAFLRLAAAQPDHFLLLATLLRACRPSHLPAAIRGLKPAAAIRDTSCERACSSDCREQNSTAKTAENLGKKCFHQCSCAWCDQSVRTWAASGDASTAVSVPAIMYSHQLSQLITPIHDRKQTVHERVGKRVQSVQRGASTSASCCCGSARR